MNYMDDNTGSLGDAGELSLEAILSECSSDNFNTPAPVEEEEPQIHRSHAADPVPQSEEPKEKLSFLKNVFHKSASSRHLADDLEGAYLDEYSDEESDTDDFDRNTADVPDGGSSKKSRPSLFSRSFGKQKKESVRRKHRDFDVDDDYEEDDPSVPTASLREVERIEEDSSDALAFYDSPAEVQPEIAAEFDSPKPEKSADRSPFDQLSSIRRPSAADIQDLISAIENGTEEDEAFAPLPETEGYTGFDQEYKEKLEHEEPNEPKVEKKVDYTTYYDMPELDTSPAEDYVPPKASESSPKEESFGKSESVRITDRITASLSGLKDRFQARRKNSSGDFDEPDSRPARPIGKSSIETDDEWDYVNANREFAVGDESVPDDFKTYLASIFLTAAYKLRGAASVVLTMEDKQEDLGEEVTTKQASTYYSANASPMQLRLRISLILLVLMGWISFGLPVFGMLRTAKVASATVMAMQFVILLLGLDVGTNAVMNAVRGRFGLEFLSVLSCIITSIDAFLVSCSSVPNEHLALCMISSASFVGVMFSSYLMARALRKSTRVPAISQTLRSVYCERDPKINEASMIKHGSSQEGFVRRSEEVSPDENMYSKLALPLMAVAFLLGVITAVAKHDGRDLIYLISVYFCAAVPFCGLLCFALPYYIGTYRIFYSGAAIAAWSGVADIGHCQNIVVTDHDLFPGNHISLSQVRIISEGDPKRILSYAGSMLQQAGTALANPFLDYMEEHQIPTCSMLNFEIFPGGGMKAIIDHQVVLCGNRAFMYLMKVPVSADFVDENSVLLAVKGELSGIFNIEYKTSPQVRRALSELVRSDIHPIFAVRDFNVTPKMLKEHFDLSTDGYDFPPYDERFEASELKEDVHQITAVVCLDGLAPFVHMARTGKSIYSATVTNLYLGIGGSFIVILMTFLKIMISGMITPLFLFVIMAVITLIMFINSFLQKF